MANPLRADVAGIATYLAAGGVVDAASALRLPYGEALQLSVRLQRRQQRERRAHEAAIRQSRSRRRR